MNRSRATVGFEYKNSTFKPNEGLKIPRTIRSNYLVLRFSDLDERTLIKDIQERYLEYYDDASKRVGFSAMKTVLKAIEVGKRTNGFKTGDWSEMEPVIRSWSETFGMPINGLMAMQSIKNLIQNSLFNQINLSSPNLTIEMEDIERGTEYSKVRTFGARLERTRRNNGVQNGQPFSIRSRR